MFRHSVLRIGALIVLLVGAVVGAESDRFFLGNGKDGSRVVSAPGTLVNSYTRLLVSVNAGGTSLQLQSATDLGAGDLLMLYQAGGHPDMASMDTSTPGLDLTGSDAGRFELARVQSVNTSTQTVTLEAPLVHPWSAAHAQVIRIPQFTEVVINAGASIVARPWDGQTGGVVAFLAMGTLSIEGRIDASFAGFRGGVFLDNTTVPEPPGGCTYRDHRDVATPLGGRKGEGVVTSRYTSNAGGSGVVANGGGGGICHNAGGGGGGNGGPGGKGGLTADSTQDPGFRDVGGIGGRALLYPSATDRLTFGGGGGAGQSDTLNGTSGGRGGGVVFIRALGMSNAGAILANGEGAAASLHDGAGGGGAGGSLYLRFASDVDCASVSANGGKGGNENLEEEPHGTGGGGGAGRILLQAATVTQRCQQSLTAKPGGPGLTVAQGRYGAGPENPDDPALQGPVERPAKPIVQLAAPVILAPAVGSRETVLRPEIRGSATPGLEVHVFIDGVDIGSVTADGAGQFVVTPSVDLPFGDHQVTAAAFDQGLWSSPATAVPFSIVLAPPVILTPPEGAIVPTDTPEIAGTAGPGLSVAVSIDDVLLGEVTADASGHWSLQVPSANALADGLHTVAATSSDGMGHSSDAAQSTFTVQTGPPSPIARITPAEQTVEPGGSVTLDGSGSTPGAGQQLARWEWEAIEGPSGVTWSSGPVQTLELAVSGSYRFRLVVVDSGGARSAPAEARVHVTGDVIPPPFAVGCGCGASGGGWGVMSLALLAGAVWLTGSRGAARRSARGSPA